jgi:hypothetical protein
MEESSVLGITNARQRVLSAYEYIAACGIGKELKNRSAGKVFRHAIVPKVSGVCRQGHLTCAACLANER